MNTTMSNKVSPSENGYVRDEPNDVYYKTSYIL